VGDFIGNLVLALLLTVLLRVLYAVCVLLVRTGDGGNTAFAVALPAGLLYIVVSNPVPVSSWTGLATGALLGVAILLSIERWRNRRSCNARAE
jgi:glucose uptake protein GlcU